MGDVLHERSKKAAATVIPIGAAVSNHTLCGCKSLFRARPSTWYLQNELKFLLL
jgi:hypothetical protein